MSKAKQKLMISHGKKTHSLEERFDCMFCLDCEIEFLQDLRKAGSMTKLIKELKLKHE